LRHTCTPSILVHTTAAGAPMPHHWELLANGHLDELLYRQGAIQNGIPFEDLRARSDVTGRGKATPDGPGWSAAIREGLPDRPAPP
jgi:hypothetical protein